MKKPSETRDYPLSPLPESYVGEALPVYGPKRSSRLAVRLDALHDPATGRLDAGRIAGYLQLPLKHLAEALGRNYPSVHKSPSALSLQPLLRPVKRILEILDEILQDRSKSLIWLNSPQPDLGRRTPLEVMLEGRAAVIEDLLEGALAGIPG
jgi:Protein of unknown function (DUF2384)